MLLRLSVVLEVFKLSSGVTVEKEHVLVNPLHNYSL